MKVKVSEATLHALNWMVAKCENESVHYSRGAVRHVPGQFSNEEPYTPSTDWSQGGPIIEREQISLDQFKGHPCRAYLGTHVRYECAMFAPEGKPLIAAMRCYVVSRLGDEVEVPEELLS